jgi:hypothetical protein
MPLYTAVPLLTPEDEEKRASHPLPLKRIVASLVGAALLGTILYAATTQQPMQQGNVGSAVQLRGDAATASTFYLIKHTFKDKADAGGWWKSQAEFTGKALETWLAKVADAGFHNTAFLPTAVEGPFYCLWEAAAGKTKADMQKFIDGSALSPTSVMVNHVMVIPAKLTGGAPTERFFGGKAAHLSLMPPKTTSTFYLIKHTFKSADDVAPLWKQLTEMSSKKLEKTMTGITNAGFHNTFFLPTAVAGPFYCLWEAEAGKTRSDMENFIDTSKLSGVSMMENRVMTIPVKLTGGAPVTPFFKA